MATHAAADQGGMVTHAEAEAVLAAQARQAVVPPEMSAMTDNALTAVLDGGPPICHRCEGTIHAPYPACSCICLHCVDDRRRYTDQIHALAEWYRRYPESADEQPPAIPAKVGGGPPAVTGRRGYQLTPQGLADGKALNELYTACYQWLVSHPDLGLLAESRVHPPDDESSPIDVLFPEPHMAGAVFEQIEADRIRLIAADRPGDIIGFHAFPLSETDPTAQRFLTAIATPAASDDTTNPIVPLPDPTTDEYGRSGVIAKMWSLNLDGIDPAAGVRDFHIAAHATPDSQDLRPSHIPWLRSATVETWDIGDPEARDAGGAAFTGIIYAAQPVYVTANVVDALAHTDPPPPEVVAAARMPHQATLLVPAHGIAPVLPPGRIDVPVTFRLGAAWDLWPAFPTWLTAAVVFANPDGSIADGVLVVLTSLIPVDHDEERLALTCHYYDTWPAPFADTLGSLATAVAIMEPDGYDTPTEAWPDGKPRKFTRSSEFRKRAARGNYVKVRVIDLDTSTHSVSPDADDPSGRSVTPHFRRGHFRRVRIGHRDDWWYETRWIPPTFVRGTGANAAVQVWRAS